MGNKNEKVGGETVVCYQFHFDTCRSRGFGFITYKEASQLDEAQKNRPHKVDGREVETKRAMPRDVSLILYNPVAYHTVD